MTLYTTRDEVDSRYEAQDEAPDVDNPDLPLLRTTELVDFWSATDFAAVRNGFKVYEESLWAKSSKFSWNILDELKAKPELCPDMSREVKSELAKVRWLLWGAPRSSTGCGAVCMPYTPPSL